MPTSRDLPRLASGAALWLLVTMGPLLWLRTRWSLDGPIAEDPVYLLIVLGAAAACATWLMQHRDETARVTRTAAGWAVGALVAVIALSSLWSIDPGSTALHALRLCGTVVIGAYLAVRLDRREQMLTLWVAVQFGCAWSTLQIARLTPGALDDDGNWVGIFVNRNLLGLVSAVGITVAALLALDALGRRRWWEVAVLAASALVDLRLLLGTGSATPFGVMLGLALVVAVVAVLRRVRPGHDRTADVLAGASVAVALASSFVLAWAAGSLGRGGNLSRRVPLWRFVRNEIGERPLQGWGYLGGWEDRGFRRQMREFVRGNDLRSAHNTVLEVALGTGLIGTVTIAVLVFLVARGAWRAALRPGPLALVVWPAAALGWFVLEGATESFLVADTLPTLLFVVAAFSTATTGSAQEPGDGVAVGGGTPVEAAAGSDHTD